MIAVKGEQKCSAPVRRLELVPRHVRLPGASTASHGRAYPGHQESIGRTEKGNQP
ncbi:hypothetical protein SSRG_00348 [Streptomyces griseoflavus Tu4000]|uniref:Uncharacterized protein n=1 Tax=Streptomyces griseoflavus Tu4000 TaxID=467200 RepID=D9XQH1_9ACTN|nr:hypothetical protein SSRG_00348 [Streptomyces griseoflavus Tu4000]